MNTVLKRTRTRLGAVFALLGVFAATFAAAALAAPNYYYLGNLAPGNHVDSTPESFRHNTVSDENGTGHRVCAGQSHSDTGEWYGSYLCGNGTVTKDYDYDLRRARAHNGDSRTTYTYAVIS